MGEQRKLSPRVLLDHQLIVFDRNYDLLSPTRLIRSGISGEDHSGNVNVPMRNPMNAIPLILVAEGFQDFIVGIEFQVQRDRPGPRVRPRVVISLLKLEVSKVSPPEPLGDMERFRMRMAK